MIRFKGSHFRRELTMMAMRWYSAYSLSYRDVEELLKERGISVDHATINRWIMKYIPMLEARFRKRKKKVGTSWRMDETYVKIKGKWFYYYRAVDQYGNTIDFYLSEDRNTKAAYTFLRQAIDNNGKPNKVNIDKSGANLAGLQLINNDLSKEKQIMIRQVKYLNNIIEQDHRSIKRIIRPMMEFKSFIGAVTKLSGIELQRIIKKGQDMLNNNLPVWKQFYALAG